MGTPPNNISKHSRVPDWTVLPCSVTLHILNTTHHGGRRGCLSPRTCARSVPTQQHRATRGNTKRPCCCCLKVRKEARGPCGRHTEQHTRRRGQRLSSRCCNIRKLRGYRHAPRPRGSRD